MGRICGILVLIDCDEISVAETSGIFRVGSRVQLGNATGVYRMAVEENLSFYGIGASYCDYVENRNRVITYGICGGCRGGDFVIGMFYLHSVLEAYSVSWIGACVVILSHRRLVVYVVHMSGLESII